MRNKGHKDPSRGPKTGGTRRLMMGRCKSKGFQGYFKRLTRYLEPEKYRFIVVFSCRRQTIAIVGPKIMVHKLARYWPSTTILCGLTRHRKICRLHDNNLKNTIHFDLYMKISLVAFYALAPWQLRMGYIMSGVSQNTVYRMRNDVKDKLDRLPLKYFDQRTYGEILSRVTNDMDNIATTLQQSLIQLITSFITVAGILIMMLTISPLMTLIALVSLPVSMLITVQITKRSQKYFASQQKCIGDINGHVEEMYAGHKIVRVFGHEEDSIAKFKEINDRLYKVGWKAQFMSGVIFPALNFVSNIGYVLICVVGGLLVAHRQIEIGDIRPLSSIPGSSPTRSFRWPISPTCCSLR